MKFRTQKITALMVAVILGASSFGSVTVMAEENTASESTDTANADTDGEVIMMDGDAISSDLITGTFKPSETTVPAQDSYEYDYMGLKFSLPKDLLKQMEEQSIAMLTKEDWTDNGDAVKYAYFSWCTMTEEQKNAEVDKIGTGYDEWMDSLAKVGVLGMYDADSQEKLDEITGCTDHKALGSSSDGKYKYYLSINKDADEDLRNEIEEIDATIIDMTPFQQISVFETSQDTDSSSEDATSVGSFETTGIGGDTYREKVFSDYDLTLVNIFTTWCSPCVNEIPELEKLYQEMKDSGIGVVGVVLDTVDSDGNQDEDTVKKAEILREKTKATYPFLIPDSTMMNGRLNGISAFPETFFVDKNGNIVGETYTGSHSLSEWEDIVKKEFDKISK